MKDVWLLIPIILALIVLPFGLLAFLPGLAFLPVGLLGLLIIRNWPGFGLPRKVISAGGLVIWISYAVWETRMYYWMQTVIAPIRVDLLLIVPALWVVTVVMVALCLKRQRYIDS